MKNAREQPRNPEGPQTPTRRGEETYRALFETEPECVKVLDRDGRLLEINPAGLRMLEVGDLEQLRGRPLLDFVEPAHRRGFREFVSSVIAGEPGRFRFEIVGLEGARRWMESTGAPLRDPAGEITGMIAVTRDITDLISVQEELRRSESRLRELVETMTEVVFEIDLEGYLVYASPVIEAILGYRPDEVVGRRFLDLIAAADRAQISAVVARTLGGEFRAASEYRVIARDGSIRWARSRAVPIRRGDRVVGIRGVAVDITDLKAAQEQLLATSEQLLRAQKIEAIGRLAGGIAHDFNNLLTVIRGHAELVAEGLGPDSPLCESVEEIQEAGRRATELTRQLLAFGRRQVLQPVRIDLNEKLSQAERLFRRILGEDVEIRLRPSPEPAGVVVDPGQIEQVLMNLVVNARDAMPGGGRLILGTSHVELDDESAEGLGIRPGAYVELRVADTGRGIPAEIQHRLFEPFFTTKETGQGSGLGLSTADGIVRQSGGAISVLSRVGKGSVFTVLLPRAEPGETAVVRGSATRSRKSARVLLIEADPAVRGLVRNALVPDGFELVETGSGPEALEVGRALRDRVDLVICGLETPGSDFLELIRQLRRRWPAVRLLIGSGSIPEPADERDLTTGVRFLEKPFTPARVLEAARRSVADPESSSEAESR